MVVVSIYRQISLAIEDHVVVDDDLAFGHHSLWPVARKRVRTAAFDDRVADTLLAAREDLLRGATRATIAAAAIVITATDRRHDAQGADTHESQ
jgi:hypothetical protein